MNGVGTTTIDAGKAVAGNSALAMGIVGTGINVVHAIAKGHDPFPVVFAGGVLTVLFVALQGSGIGSAAAAVYLLGAFIVNGTDLLNIVSDVTTSSTKKGK